MSDDRVGERMLVVRVGTRDDFETAADLWQEALLARAGIALPDGQRERVLAWADDPDAFLIVVSDADAMIGMAVGLQALADDGVGPPVQGLCHLTTIAVAPGRWGEGIGRLVVHGAIDEARRRGYRRAQLWTYATNARAIALYEGEGFTRSGRTQITPAGLLNLHFDRDL